MAAMLAMCSSAWTCRHRNRWPAGGRWKCSVATCAPSTSAPAAPGAAARLVAQLPLVDATLVDAPVLTHVAHALSFVVSTQYSYVDVPLLTLHVSSGLVVPLATPFAGPVFTKAPGLAAVLNGRNSVLGPPEYAVPAAFTARTCQ